MLPIFLLFLTAVSSSMPSIEAAASSSLVPTSSEHAALASLDKESNALILKYADAAFTRLKASNPSASQPAVYIDRFFIPFVATNGSSKSSIHQNAARKVYLLATVNFLKREHNRNKITQDQLTQLLNENDPRLTGKSITGKSIKKESYFKFVEFCKSTFALQQATVAAEKLIEVYEYSAGDRISPYDILLDLINPLVSVPVVANDERIALLIRLCTAARGAHSLPDHQDIPLASAKEAAKELVRTCPTLQDSLRSPKTFFSAEIAAAEQRASRLREPSIVLAFAKKLQSEGINEMSCFDFLGDLMRAINPLEEKYFIAKLCTQYRRITSEDPLFARNVANAKIVEPLAKLKAELIDALRHKSLLGDRKYNQDDIPIYNAAKTAAESRASKKIIKQLDEEIVTTLLPKFYEEHRPASGENRHHLKLTLRRLMVDLNSQEDGHCKLLAHLLAQRAPYCTDSWSRTSLTLDQAQGEYRDLSGKKNYLLKYDDWKSCSLDKDINEHHTDQATTESLVKRIEEKLPQYDESVWLAGLISDLLMESDDLLPQEQIKLMRCYQKLMLSRHAPIIQSKGEVVSFLKDMMESNTVLSDVSLEDYYMKEVVKTKVNIKLNQNIDSAILNKIEHMYDNDTQLLSFKELLTEVMIHFYENDNKPAAYKLYSILNFFGLDHIFKEKKLNRTEALKYFTTITQHREYQVDQEKNTPAEEAIGIAMQKRNLIKKVNQEISTALAATDGSPEMLKEKLEDLLLENSRDSRHPAYRVDETALKAYKCAYLLAKITDYPGSLLEKYDELMQDSPNTGEPENYRTIIANAEKAHAEREKQAKKEKRSADIAQENQKAIDVTSVLIENYYDRHPAGTKIQLKELLANLLYEKKFHYTPQASDCFLYKAWKDAPLTYATEEEALNFINKDWLTNDDFHENLWCLLLKTPEGYNTDIAQLRIPKDSPHTPPNAPEVPSYSSLWPHEEKASALASRSHSPDQALEQPMPSLEQANTITVPNTSGRALGISGTATALSAGALMYLARQEAHINKQITQLIGNTCDATGTSCADRFATARQNGMQLDDLKMLMADFNLSSEDIKTLIKATNKQRSLRAYKKLSLIPLSLALLSTLVTGYKYLHKS